MTRGWLVLQRPSLPGADPDIVFVKAGICWPALFIPVIWGLFRRQWTAVGLYLLLALLLGGAARLSGLDGLTEAALAGLLNLAAALFGNDWRAWRLQAADGYRLVGVVGARNLATAERRWFTELAPAAAVPAGRRAAPGAGSWPPLLGEGA
jgi:hypothetical protein